MFSAIKNAFLNLFRLPYTADYPAEPLPLPEGYRGLIEFNAEACIWCDKCEKVCPPRAIVFNQDAEGEKEYRYNEWLCIFCGECVRACPKPGEALWQSELKARPGVKADRPNSGWFEWQDSAKAGRESYAAAKKAKRAQKAEKPSQTGE